MAITGRQAGIRSDLGRLGWVLGLAAMVVAIGQSSKLLVSRQLGDGRVIALFGGLVRLVYSVNTGAAFSILRSWGGFFILVAAVVLIAIIVSYRRIAGSPPLARIAVGLILGG